MPGPLDGVTVLDLTTGIAGPYATKLLADAGAGVWKIERPGGDFARRMGPFPGDAPHPEKSGVFFYYNTNKQSCVVDLRRPQARAVFERLLGAADLVVESMRPGALTRLVGGWDHIHARRPDVSLVSISNFGQTGPYRDYLASELVLFGYGGEMYSMGVPERAPVKMYGVAALVESGAAAAVAAMGALISSLHHGCGQHVDVSLADCQFGGVDRRHAWIVGYEFSGKRGLRGQGVPTVGAGATVYPCADGYVELTGIQLRLDRLADMLGHPDWLRDPIWQRPGVFYEPDAVGEFQAHLIGWLIERTKREVWAEARRAKVLCGPLFSVDELFADEHFRGRGFWQRLEHPALGTLEIPGRPFQMSDSAWEARAGAPLLGQHTRDILASVGYDGGEIDALVAAGVVETA